MDNKNTAISLFRGFYSLSVDDGAVKTPKIAKSEIIAIKNY
jgi:hypothetical protein